MTELYDGRASGRVPTVPPRTTPWVAVAIVAILAGVGTATIGPDGGSPSGPAAEVGAERVRTICPRMVELTFNPRVPRGLKVAKVAFRFTVEHAAQDRDAVRARTDQGWEAMVSMVLRTLKRRTPDELKLDGGIDAIEKDLRAAIDGVLFTHGEARTREILWEQILVQ